MVQRPRRRVPPRPDQDLGAAGRESAIDTGRSGADFRPSENKFSGSCSLRIWVQSNNLSSKSRIPLTACRNSVFSGFCGTLKMAFFRSRTKSSPGSGPCCCHDTSWNVPFLINQSSHGLPTLYTASLQHYLGVSHKIFSNFQKFDLLYLIAPLST